MTISRKHVGDRKPGNINAYRHDSCRCYPCCHAWAAYDKRRKADGWQPYVDAGPAREHIAQLMASGVPVTTIARRAGVSLNGLNGIRGVGVPQTARVRTELAARILAIRPEVDIIGAHGYFESTGTYRRLRALQAKGFPKSLLARRLGTRYLDLDEQRMVRPAFADAVRRLYDELWDADPERLGLRPCAITVARTRAAAAGWALPIEWDDDEIDDPTAQPRFARRIQVASERPVTDDEVEDVRWILRTADVEIGTKVGREIVAARLGVDPKRVEYIVTKRLPKLARELVAA